MKPIILLFVLGLTFSCAKSNDTGPSRSKPRTETNPQNSAIHEYKVSVTSSVEIDQTEIKFLEDQDSVDQDENGKCFVRTEAGKSYPFRLFENELVLYENNHEIEFNRSSGRSYSLFGEWVRVDEAKGMTITTTLEIASIDTITIGSVCQKK